MIGFRLCPAGGTFSFMFAVLSVLRHMRDLNFKKACWISNFIFTDGTRSSVCAGEAAGVCDKCGFYMAGEERAVMDLAPDTIKAGMTLRVR